jgi:hypothetical protein
MGYGEKWQKKNKNSKQKLLKITSVKNNMRLQTKNIPNKTES